MKNNYIYPLLMITMCASAISIAGCTSDTVYPETTTTTTLTATSITTTTQQSTTPQTSTAPTTQATTTQSTTTLTKTATLIDSAPPETNKEQIQKAVVDMFVPEFKPTQELIPILLTLTNPIDSQWNCDIPIVFSDLADETNVFTFMINVSLDVGETREVLVWGIAMAEARWKVKVGFKTRIVFTS